MEHTNALETTPVAQPLWRVRTALVEALYDPAIDLAALAALLQLAAVDVESRLNR